MIVKLGIALLATLSCTLPVAAEPFHHAFGEWREYHRDWLAACPDLIDEDATDYYGYSCFASTGSQQLNAAGLPAYKLTIMRNRLTGDIDVALTVATDNAQTDTSRPLVVALFGDAVMQFDFAADLETRHNTTNQYFVVDPGRKVALIEAMKQRNALTLTIPLSGCRSRQ